MPKDDDYRNSHSFTVYQCAIPGHLLVKSEKPNGESSVCDIAVKPNSICFLSMKKTTFSTRQTFHNFGTSSEIVNQPATSGQTANQSRICIQIADQSPTSSMTTNHSITSNMTDNQSTTPGNAINQSEHSGKIGNQSVTCSKVVNQSETFSGTADQSLINFTVSSNNTAHQPATSSSKNDETNQFKRDNRGLFKCSICFKAYRLHGPYCNHMKNCQAHQPATSSSKNDESDQFKRDNRGLFKCSICFKAYRLHGPYCNHMKNCQAENEEAPEGVRNCGKCLVCHEQLDGKDSLEKHMWTHGNKPFVCPICEKSFKTHGSLGVHMKIHVNARTGECAVCKRVFRKRISLRNHMRIHISDLPFKCTICGKGFKWEKNRARHMDQHSRETSGPRCPVCRETFENQTDLRSHIGTHEKAHRCSVCEKTFYRSDWLRQHMRVTHVERSYKCVLCGKGFKTKSQLQSHAIVHSDERPYQCSQCDMKFKNMAGLQEHKKTHDRKIKHTCLACGKWFKEKRNIDAHVCGRPMKGYECRICKMSVTTSFNLARHERNKHGIVEESYSCSHCSKKCHSKNDLVLHLKSHCTGSICMKCGKEFCLCSDFNELTESHHKKPSDSPVKKSKIPSSISCDMHDLLEQFEAVIDSEKPAESTQVLDYFTAEDEIEDLLQEFTAGQDN